MSRHGRLVIALLFFLGVINFADKAVIGFAAVPIMKEFHITPEQWGWVGSGFYWLFSLSAIVVGGLSDRVGTKKVLAGLSVVWAAVQFATLFTFSLPFLVATRIMLGAGEGPSYGVSLHASAKWLPPEQRGFGYSLMSIGGAVGPALLAPVLIALIVNLGWRWAFALLGVVGFAWLLIWLIFAKESPDQQQMNVPVTQISPGRTSWSSALPFIRSRNFIFSVFAGFAGYWGVTMLVLWTPAYLVNVRHFQMARLGLLAGLPWLATGIAEVLFGWISDDLYRKTKNTRLARVHLSGSLLLLSGISFYLVTIVPSTGLAILFLCLGPALSSSVFGIGGALVAELITPEHRGLIQGILVGLSTTAGLIAPIITGMVIGQGGTQNVIVGYNHAFGVAALVTLVLGILFWIGVRPPKVRTSSRMPNEFPDV